MRWRGDVSTATYFRFLVILMAMADIHDGVMLLIREVYRG